MALGRGGEGEEKRREGKRSTLNSGRKTVKRGSVPEGVSGLRCFQARQSGVGVRRGKEITGGTNKRKRSGGRKGKN